MLEDLRSSQGFRITVRVERLCEVPTRALLPVTFCTYATAGRLSMKAMARSVILRVRSKVAPSGITSSTVKNPWSSSGIKLVGITRFNTKMNTITIPKPARMRLGFRIAFSSKWPYLLFPLANQILILRKTIFFFFLFGRRIIAHMAGLNVNATTVDNSTETTIVMEN